MVSDVKSGTEKSVASKVGNTSTYFGGGLNTDLSIYHINL